MTEFRWEAIVAAAVVIPVVSVFAVWLARRIGRFMLGSVQRSFGLVVVDVMSPDMAHLSKKVTSALDELRDLNTAQHSVVEGRLGGVEGRLTDVETRLATVEMRLNIRPADARTRATDTPGA